MFSPERIGRTQLFRIVLTVSVFTLLMDSLVACTPKSGTRLSTDSAALQSIKSIHISVTQAELFTIVQSEGAPGAVVGGAAFGLVGALVGAGIDSYRTSSKSTALEESVTPYLQELNATALLASHVQAALVRSNHFDKVDHTASSPSNMADGTLTLQIQTWGLRSCVGESSPEHMQVEWHIDEKLIHRKEGRTIWERSEVYRDPICRPFPEFRDQPTLLRERLHQSLETVSGVLINRILYP